MRSTAIPTLLLGVTFGVGLTLLSLYTQKPDRVAASIERIGEVGRARKAKEEEKRIRRERLRAVGFSDNEIDEIL